jgi:putative transposase
VTVHLDRGARITLDNTTFVLRRKISETCWQIEDPSTGRIVERESSELLRLYRTGDLRFGTSTLELARGAVSSEIPKSAQDVIKMRRRYVTAVEGLPVSQEIYDIMIEKVWEQLAIQADRIQEYEPGLADLLRKRPYWTTVYRWSFRYKRCGCDSHALLHRTRRRQQNWPQEVLDICDEAIETIYLTIERKTVQDTLDFAAQRTKETNLIRHDRGLDALPTPGRRVFKRLLRELPAFDVYCARYGRQAAIVKFRSVKGHTTTNAALERGEIDHTPLDLFVVDEETFLPLGRPYITLCIDDFTRCILGVYVGFIPPSYLSVALCLKDAFFPKDWVREEYPMVTSEPQAFGIMQTLVVDQALEFHSKGLEDACLRLGVEIVYSPRKTPWFKGKIEKMVGAVNRGVAHGTRGTTFRNITERGDYNPEKFATIRLSTLKAALRIWIYDVYHQKKHRALGMPPEEMWRRSIKLEDIRMAEDPNMLHAVMGRPLTRVLTHKGIEFEGLFYNSDALRDLRNRYGAKLDVDIRVDDGNIGSIHLIYQEILIKVRALRYAYAEGISLWQHKVFQDNAYENNPDGWLEAKERIRRMYEEEFKLMRGVTRRAGRLLEGGAIRKKGGGGTPALPAPAGADGPSAQLGNTMPLPSLPAQDMLEYEAVIQERSFDDQSSHIS